MLLVDLFFVFVIREREIVAVPTSDLHSFSCSGDLSELDTGGCADDFAYGGSAEELATDDSRSDDQQSGWVTSFDSF